MFLIKGMVQLKHHMKHTSLLVLVGLSISLTLFSFVSIALARPLPCPPGTSGCPNITLTNPIGISSVEEAIQRFIEIVAFYLGPPIVIILVMIGAYQMLFAAGDPERFSTGKKTVLYAIIGYVVLLLATGVGYIILDVLR